MSSWLLKATVRHENKNEKQKSINKQINKIIEK